MEARVTSETELEHLRQLVKVERRMRDTFDELARRRCTVKKGMIPFARHFLNTTKHPRRPL